MSVTLVFLALLMAAFLGWLLTQSIRVRPWQAQVAGVAHSRALPEFFTAQRVGLATFLAVATSIFALTVSAYVMRMSVTADWHFLPTPRLAWLNTGFLVLGSVALHMAWRAPGKGRPEVLRLGLGFGAIGALAFLVGQVLLWRQLSNAGYFLAGDPGSAFFALMSGLHGLHLLGGLYVLLRIASSVRRGLDPGRIRDAVGLCALYWHYLLFIWIVLFVVLFIGAEPLYALCRG